VTCHRFGRRDLSRPPSKLKIVERTGRQAAQDQSGDRSPHSKSGFGLRTAEDFYDKPAATSVTRGLSQRIGLTRAALGTAHGRPQSTARRSVRAAGATEIIAA